MGRREEAIEDFQIIRAVLDGNREAYAELVRLHHARVLSLCLSLLLDKAEAEDAAQETFLKAFNALHQYKRNASFTAWLCRIASNHCFDVLRKRKRQKTDSLDQLLDQSDEASGDRQTQIAAPPERGAEREEKLAWAMKMLSSLSADHRQILLLREVDELSYDQIAAVLRCSLDSVKSRLWRARRQLQQTARHFLNEDSFIQ